MGIVVKNDEKQSDLQRRITADLRAKQSGKSRRVDDINIVDEKYDAEHSNYRKDLEKSWLPGWVWLVGLVLVAGAAYLIANAISGGTK